MDKLSTLVMAVTMALGVPMTADTASSPESEAAVAGAAAGAAEASAAERSPDRSAKQQDASENRSYRPKLRAGIDEKQLAHAVTIVETGQEMDLPRRAYVVAISTAMQESQLRVLANVNVPESFDFTPRDGYGRDHDSIGIFQQRASLYSINDVKWSMDPRYSAMKFYHGLKSVDGWQGMTVAEAAQAVQVSAFPDAYAKHQGAAELIVDSILEWQNH